MCVCGKAAATRTDHEEYGKIFLKYKLGLIWGCKMKLSALSLTKTYVQLFLSNYLPHEL